MTDLKINPAHYAARLVADHTTADNKIRISNKYLFQHPQVQADEVATVATSTIAHRAMYSSSAEAEIANIARVKSDYEIFYDALNYTIAQRAFSINTGLTDDYLDEDSLDLLDFDPACSAERLNPYDKQLLLSAFFTDLLRADPQFTVNDVPLHYSTYQQTRPIIDQALKLVAQQNTQIDLIDDGLPDLLGNWLTSIGHNETLPVWYAPMQVENHNTEGGEVGMFVDDLRELLQFGDRVPVQELDDLVANCPKIIEHLFESQGYGLADLFWEDRVGHSVFLTSFIEEVDNYIGATFAHCFLTVEFELALADWDNTIWGKTNSLDIKPNMDVNIGLFDATFGAGSIMSITLEKQWLLPLTVADLATNFGGMHLQSTYNNKCDYGYSPADVYDTGQLATTRTVLTDELEAGYVD